MKKYLFIILSLSLSIILMSNIVFAGDYENHWAKETINEFKQAGIVQGDEYGNINPDNNITRAEFIKILNRSMNYTVRGKEQYKDVVGNEWYAEDFLIANREGYLKGDEYGNANPNNSITRAEVSVILSRILMVGNNEKMEFQDESEVPQWAYSGISALVQNKLINGYEDNTFRPNNNITRAESFTLVNRILKLQKQETEKNELINQLQATNKDLEIIYRNDGTVGMVSGSPIEKTINNTNDLKEVMEQIKKIFEINNVQEEFKIVETVDKSRYVMQQVYNGIEVYGREIVIILDKENKITSINSNYLKNINISIIPQISDEQVEKIIENEFGSEILSSELAIYSLKEDKPVLAWKTTIRNSKGINTIILNSNTGEIISNIPQFITYDQTIGSGTDIFNKYIEFDVIKQENDYKLANSSISMNKVANFNNLIREYSIESIISKDNVWEGRLNEQYSVLGDKLASNAITVYKNVLNIDSFYSDILSNNTVPGYSIYLIMYEDLETKNNAMAEVNTGKLVFGNDTDNNSMGIAIDVVGHEMTHVITKSINKGIYEGHSAAVNEAYSDIMGELIDHYYNPQKQDWVTGDSINAGKRSLSNPEAYGTASKLNGNNFFENAETNTYYSNSTVVSHAAYLMYEGGIKDVEKLATLWYKSIKYMSKKLDYTDCRYAVLKAAEEMEMTEQEINIINRAFDEVGIKAPVSKEFNIKIGNEVIDPLIMNNEELPKDITLIYDGEGIIEKWSVWINGQNKEIGSSNNQNLTINSEEIGESKVINISLKLKEYNFPITKQIFLDSDYYSIGNIGVKIDRNRFEYEASKENPLVEGSFLAGIVLNNKTAKNIKEWQIWSEKEKAYVKYDGNENEKEIYLKLENYIKVDELKYCIKVKAILEDNQIIEREIYQILLQIEKPSNLQIINLNKDLEIKWNGEQGRGYILRMVEYYTNENGEEETVEVLSGELLTGDSFIVEASKLKKEANYRIAIKEFLGQNFDIILISTITIGDPIIENIEEIKTSTEGEEVKIKLSGKKADDEKYSIAVYDETGNILWLIESKNNEVRVISEDRAIKGKYQIGVNIIKGQIVSEEKKYTIEIK